MGNEQVDIRAVLMEALDNDPDTRPKFRALVKQKFPKAPIPEVDLDQRFETYRSELRKELDDERLARKKDKDAADLAAARRSVMDDPELRITEEEIAEVEKIMQDPTLGPIASHKAAAMLYRSMKAVATPRPFALTADVPGLGASAEQYKGILDDPQKWRGGRIEEIVNDFRNGRGHKWPVA